MKFGFYSTMVGMPWGGSEVLWSEAAHRMLDAGHEVAVSYRYWKEESSKIVALRDAGASISLRNNFQTAELSDALTPSRWPQSDWSHARRWLRKEKPDFVMISVGNHLDPLPPTETLLRCKIPYAINLQAAGPDYICGHLESYRASYRNAVKVFCVSKENQNRLETNLAMPLPQAEIVDNPFNVPLDSHPAWPCADQGFRLACIGRLHFSSKGQDLLIDVMRQPKWQQRDLSIHFFGESQGNLQHLTDLIDAHQLQASMRYEGYADNIEELWSQYHGLILPSRYEGAALAVVESLLCDRVCITTDVGRNREFITHGETGFLAPAATATLIDEALEDAWQQRSAWQSIGQRAGERLREHYSRDPASDFYQRMLALAESKA